MIRAQETCASLVMVKAKPVSLPEVAVCGDKLVTWHVWPVAWTIPRLPSVAGSILTTSTEPAIAIRAMRLTLLAYSSKKLSISISLTLILPCQQGVREMRVKYGEILHHHEYRLHWSKSNHKDN